MKYGKSRLARQTMLPVKSTQLHESGRLIFKAMGLFLHKVISMMIDKIISPVIILQRNINRLAVFWHQPFQLTDQLLKLDFLDSSIVLLLPGTRRPHLCSPLCFSHAALLGRHPC